MAKKSRLYKTKEGASIGGVCKGVSEVYDVDVSIVRILTAIITLFFAGSLIIVYFVMYLVLPDKSEVITANDDFKINQDDYTINDDDFKY